MAENSLQDRGLNCGEEAGNALLDDECRSGILQCVPVAQGAHIEYPDLFLGVSRIISGLKVQPIKEFHFVTVIEVFDVEEVLQFSNFITGDLSEARLLAVQDHALLVV